MVSCRGVSAISLGFAGIEGSGVTASDRHPEASVHLSDPPREAIGIIERFWLDHEESITTLREKTSANPGA